MYSNFKHRWIKVWGTSQDKEALWGGRAGSNSETRWGPVRCLSAPLSQYGCWLSKWLFFIIICKNVVSYTIMICAISGCLYTPIKSLNWKKLGKKRHFSDLFKGRKLTSPKFTQKELLNHVHWWEGNWIHEVCNFDHVYPLPSGPQAPLPARAAMDLISFPVSLIF